MHNRLTFFRRDGQPLKSRSSRRRPLRGIETLEVRQVLSASGVILELGPVAPAQQVEVANAVPGELLIQFRDTASASNIRSLYRAHGLRELERLYNSADVPGIRRVAVPAAAIDAVARALQKNPNVQFVEPNFMASSFATVNDSFYRYQWNFNNSTNGGINVEQAWDVSTGAGAIVAVLDTGIAYKNHQDATGTYYQAPDLASTRFVSGYDFINNDAHANDDHSHGTHVAGTIAQSTNNSRGVAGVAYDATLMPVKVLGKDNSGSYSAIANGIRWAADQGAHIINMSLGGSSASKTLEDAVAYAYGRGVTIIAAAGNNGTNAVSYPAAYDNYVIAVSATRFDETLAGYSNYGSSISLAAPGGDLSVDQNGDGYGDGILQNTFNPNTKNTSDFGYYFYQGTSMAAPHVAGVAAMIVSQGITNPVEVRHILESTAKDRGPVGKDIYFGHGIVDAGAAMEAIRNRNTAPPGDTNTAPVAVDDTASTTQGTPVTISVLANDSDADGDPLTIASVTRPSNGKAVVNANQTITYTPNSNFSGPTDSFTYTISDGRGGSATAKVSITVSAVNTAPVAVNDTASTTQGTPVTIVVLANDSDADGDRLTVVSVTDLVNGTVVINNDQTITYTPHPSFSGTDTFTYTISDGHPGGTATATVSITVSADDQNTGDDQGASNPVRVVDLGGSVTTARNQWRAVVTVTVADASGIGAVGLTVTARWSNGRSFTGITDAAGKVTATSAQMNNKVNSISFRVENVDHPDYDPTLNSDPDGDSNGTSIIVYKDGSTAAGGFQASNDDQGSASPGRPQAGRAAVTEITATDANRNGRGTLAPASQSIAPPLGEIATWVALVQQGDAAELGNRADRSDVATRYDDTTVNHSVAVIDAPQVANTAERSRSASSSLRQRDSLASKSPLASTIADAAHDEAMLAFMAN